MLENLPWQHLHVFLIDHFLGVDSFLILWICNAWLQDSGSQVGGGSSASHMQILLLIVHTLESSASFFAENTVLVFHWVGGGYLVSGLHVVGKEIWICFCFWLLKLEKGLCAGWS